MKSNKLLSCTLVGLSLAAMLSACNGGTAPNSEASKETVTKPEKPPEPVEIKVHAAGVSDDELNARFKEALKKKFPHITVTWLPSSGAQNTIEEYIARGDIPDIIRGLSSTVRTKYLDLGLGYDMNELVKKYKYDLTRFNPIFINGFVELSAQNGELYGLPVSPFFSRVLYYNKDVFDKFGQPYLKDGMNWDQIYEAAKKMTRTEDGIDYRGFSANASTFLTYNEYSLSTLDPAKDELSHFDTWQKILNNYIRFFQIPGNAIRPTLAEEGAMFQKGTVAIHADIYSPYLDLSMLKNWDMVSTPIIDGAPKKIGTFPPGYLMITKQSKHKDEAFQVIMEMLSDDVQMKDSRNGFLPTLAKKEFLDVLAQDSKAYKGKNMKAVTYYEFAPLRPTRAKGMTVIETNTADALMRDAFLNSALGKDDVNTALRKVDEQLKKEVEKERSKTK
ncbi:ABC transporter substrate-binding protein [Paenibacillus ginsengarvi]|uniref:Extracellular solute-binding protein n=1 Tax=Paenibacillus ginsengarvi TaxID=400777 RepID=A0A3B0C069_9BACL|nr:extracellular solute-binding protein [Paenibacillus ginsengarvi]RKN78922.1 extracellular solute-binding protein [Paenibacillus ginsengarvi]